MNRSPRPCPDPLVLPAITLCLHLDHWYSHFIIFAHGGWSRLWPALNSMRLFNNSGLWAPFPGFWPLPNPMDLSELPNSSLLSQNQWNHKYKLKCIKVIRVTNVITKNVIYSYQILGGAGAKGRRAMITQLPLQCTPRRGGSCFPAFCFWPNPN